MLKPGMTFGMYGSNSIAEIVSVIGNSVTYFFHHDREREWTHDVSDFKKISFAKAV